MKSVVDRFLKYVKFDTRSDEESDSTPSTPGQLKFARDLGEELKGTGLQEVSVDENGYVMATLPANINKVVPTIGFIAHMDTSPDMAGANVNPKFVENFQGDNIILNQEKNIILSPATFPELRNYIGETLITTDGTTLLGADDKAGIAEIITAMEFLLTHPEIPHGKIRIGFTPDEEIGRGADHFDVAKFKTDLAYTIDGGPVGELEYENFNAASAKITINGINIHPGTAKNKMKNSMLIAAEFINMFPQKETPANTEGYEGFYHLTKLNGDVEQTHLSYIIRDFDQNNFEKRKKYFQKIGTILNQKYGERTVEVELIDQYYNMKEKVEGVKHLITIASRAMEELGISPQIKPIRGGTDGARLSYMGLPTPNLFTGGHNFHGKFEFIPISAMDKAVNVIIKIAELYATVV